MQFYFFLFSWKNLTFFFFSLSTFLFTIQCTSMKYMMMSFLLFIIINSFLGNGSEVSHLCFNHSVSFWSYDLVFGSVGSDELLLIFLFIYFLLWFNNFLFHLFIYLWCWCLFLLLIICLFTYIWYRAVSLAILLPFFKSPRGLSFFYAKIKYFRFCAVKIVDNISFWFYGLVAKNFLCLGVVCFVW